MKTHLSILLLILCTQNLSAQQNLIWASPNEIDQINLPGDKHILMQFCLTTADSVLHTGYAQFEDTRLGKLQFSYTMHFKDTILVKTELYSKTLPDSMRLFFIKYVGDYKVYKNDKKTEMLIGTMLKPNGREILVLFERNKRRGRTRLTFMSIGNN